MKSIILKYDNEGFFYNMREHKTKLEAEVKRLISWENYILFLYDSFIAGGLKGGKKQHGTGN